MILNDDQANLVESLTERLRNGPSFSEYDVMAIAWLADVLEMPAFKLPLRLR